MKCSQVGCRRLVAPAHRTRSSRVGRSIGRIGALVALAIAAATGAHAQQLVTINETFTGTTVGSDWQLGGTNYTPVLTAGQGIDPSGDGWLRLTSAGANQATYAMNTTSFSGADSTIAVKFNYAAYGGTTGSADGITFFLADASKTFGVGAYGGSLGYAQQTSAGGGSGNINGLNGGYIGLGIDEYGNYSNPTEGRVGGPGFIKGNVSIRGPGQGLTGYEYLGGTGLLTTPIAFSGSRPTGDNERIFQVVITATNQLTVYMQAGANAPMESLYTIDLSGYERPENLIMGFTGSTGGENNIHEIQGLKLASQAASIWDRGAGTNSWGTGVNWKGDQTPSLGADILLSNQFVNTAQSIDVGAGQTRSIRSLQIDAPFSYTLDNGTLQFNDQGILGPSGILISQSEGSAVHTINSNIITDHDIEFRNASTSTLNLTGAVNNSGNTITITGSGNTSVAGVISGSGALKKAEGGEAIVSGNNTFSGGTILNAGTLTVGHNNALGTGGVTIKSGTLGSNASNTIANDISLQGSAALSNITTAGTLTQNNSHTLTMSGATQSGAVNLSDDNTGRTLTVQVDGGTSTISGVIQNGGSSAGSVTKTGNGTLVLSGANTYTGTTTINTGTIRLGASDVLANSSSLNIAGGTFNLGGYSDKVGNLSFSNGGVLDFGSGGGASNFVFDNIASQSGVLTINNWVNGSDNLGTTVNGLNVANLYFSGEGVATIAAAPTTLGAYGSAYLITPEAQSWRTWTTTGSTAWGTAGNWTPNGTPNANNALALFTGTAANATSTLGGNRTLNGLRFDTNAKSYTINGANTLTMDSPVTGGIAFIQQKSGNNQTLSFTTLQLNKNTVFDVTGAGNLTVSAAVSGANNLVKEGAGTGTLVLSGNNTGLTGNIFVNAGTLQASNSGALGTTAGTTSVADGGTLAVSGTISSAEAITISGQGANSTGALRNLANNNSLSGALTVAANSRINSDSGTLTLSGAISGTGRNLTLGGAGNITVSSAIGLGTGGVTLDGTGTITYSGGSANTYTGSTNVNSGTLALGKTAGTNSIAGDLVIGDGSGAANSALVRLNAGNQIANNVGLTINSDGRLDLNDQTETIASLSGSGNVNNGAAGAATLTINGTNTTTFSGVIQDTGGNLNLIKQGTGKLTLSGANSYQGGTSLQSGIIAIQNNTALGSGAVTVSSGGNLELSGGLTNIANAIAINGAGTNAGDGAIESTAGTNTLTGTVTLQSNSRIQSDSGSQLNIQGLVTGTNRSLNLGGAGNITVTGNIQTGAGTLTKDGTGYVILNPTANNSTFTGGTFVNGGTLEVQRTTALGTTAGGATVASGATLAISGGISIAETPLSLSGMGDGGGGALRNVSGTNTVSGSIALPANASIGSASGTLTVSGVVSGAGSMTKVGAGTVTFSGGSANTYSGGVNVNDGTLIFNKSASVSASGAGAVVIGDNVGAANSAVLQTNATNQLSNSAGLTINSDGRFNLNNTNQTIASLAGTGNVTQGSGNLTVGNAASTAFSGTLSGTGQFTKTGTGTLTVGGTDGTNSFAPATINVNQGTFQLGANNIVAGALNFNGGTFSLNGFNETVSGATISNSSYLDFNSLGGILDFTNGIYSGGTLTISNWAGSISGGGASQLLLPGSISGAFLANITFDGFSAGAKLVGNEIVPLTGTVYEWNIAGGGNWNSDSNWTPNPAGTNIGPNGNNVAVVLGNAATGNTSINMASNRTIGYLTFNDDNKYTLSTTANRALTLNVNGGLAQINLSGTGGGEIATRLVLSDNVQISQNATALFTISGNISGNNRDITIAGAGDTLISGVIGTTGGEIIKNNGGKLTLSGANTFSGGTTINGGTISISANNNLGSTSGVLRLNGGTLQTTGVVAANRSFIINSNGGTLQTDANLTNSNIISGTGTLNKTGAATFTTSGASANTHTGDINVVAGTYQVSKSANVSAIGDSAAVVADGTLQFNGSNGYNAETIGSLSGGGTVNNASGTAMTLTTGGNNANTTFSGVIQDSGANLSLTKTGTGTMTLTGANTYAGLTTISNGVLNIQNAAALGTTGSGTTVNAGGALELEHGTGMSIAEAIAINNTANGSLRNISGNNTLTGTLTLNGTSTIRSDANVLTLQGLVTGTNRALTLDGAGDITISGNITTGAGTLTKNGAGYVILSGASTFTGVTTINTGTVEIRSAGALGSTSNGTSVANGATLAFGGTGTIFNSEALTLRGAGVGSFGALRNIAGNNTTGGSITLAQAAVIGVDGATTLTANGTVSGANSLTKVGDGTLILGGNNTYSGGTIITAGRLQISSDGAAGGNSGRLGVVPNAASAGNVTINGGTLATSATMTLHNNRGIAIGASGGSIETMAGTLTYNGIVAGNSNGTLTKLGSGTLLLGGVNTFTGDVHLNEGTLQIAADNRLGNSANDLVFNGGTLATTATMSLGAGRSVVVNPGNGTFNVGTSTTLTVDGIASGSGAVIKTGTGTAIFAADNDYSGGTTISTGTLQIGNGGTTGSTGSGAIANSGTLNVNRSDTFTLPGLLSGTGNFGQIGSGTTVFSANNTYSGTTTISNGTLQIGAGGTTGSLGSGSVTNNAALVFNRSDSHTVANTIGGSGSVTQLSTGTTILSGNNTYAGVTNIDNGTLAVTANNALGSTTGGTVIADDATLDFRNVNYSTTEALTVNGGTIAGSTGTSTFAGGVALGTGGVTVNVTGTQLTLNGAISGSTGLTKTGSGTLTLGGTTANTYTGGTNINAGTLSLNKTPGVNALTGNIVIGDGAGTDTLRLDAANQIADTAAITMTSGGAPTLNLNGFSERIGSLNSTNTNAIVALGSPGAATTFTVGDANVSAYAGTITGGANAGLVKVGSSNLTLSGNNTYAGNTTVSEGGLIVQHSNALGSGGGTTTVENGATLALQGGVTVSSETSLNLTGNGIAGWVGALLNVDSNNAWDGNITLGGTSSITNWAGTLRVGATNLSHTLSLGNNTLGVGAVDGTTITLNSAIGGTGSLLIGSGTYTGTVNINNSNTYSGATTIYTGTVNIGSNNALGSSAGGTTVETGATVDFRNVNYSTAEAVTLNGGTIAASTGNSTFAGNVTLGTGGGSVDVGGTQFTMSGNIGGSSGLTKSGSGNLIVTGNNTYSGATTINSGTLQVGNGGTSGTLGNGSGAVTNNGSLVFNRSNDLTVANAIGGSGNLIKNGAGTVTLTGANSYSGATNVNNGTLVIANSTGLGSTAGGTTVASGATLALSGGVAVGNESLTLQNGATFRNLDSSNSFAGNLSLSGSTAVINESGSLTLTGGINGSNVNIAFSGAGSTFLSGAIALGSGTMTSSGTMTFDSSVSFAGNLTLAGGTLNLNGAHIAVNKLSITGDTILDFGNSAGSSLTVNSLYIAAGKTVTITNWVEWVDWLQADSYVDENDAPIVVDHETPAAPPLDQIDFQDWNTDPVWRDMTNEITPTPEPSTYGAMLLSALGGLLYWRRRRQLRAK